MGLFKLIKTDIKANKGNLKGKVIAVSYRFAFYFAHSKNILLKIPGFLYLKWYQFTFSWFMGVEIPEYVVIGEALQIWHATGLVINSGVKIGNNVLLRHTTTIGNKFEGSGVPTIGNNVSIGAHSVIIGDITIGDNVIIGAGCIITKSIPDNCIAYGNPLVIKLNIKN